MSEIKVNKISPRAACGTVTLGDSGDTFTIPAGATITNSGTANGFGATGAVNWQTTVKTGTFTAVAGEGYFVDTTSGGFNVNLPAGTAGAVVGFKDYANTFDTGNLTLVQNGSDKIGGSSVNEILQTEGIAVTLVFVDSTQGWLVTDSGLQTDAPTAQYIQATGGTAANTPCGNFKTHTFTGPGTFTVCSAGNSAGSNTIEYLVVAGGGGAAGGPPGTVGTGGGGANSGGPGTGNSPPTTPAQGTDGGTGSGTTPPGWAAGGGGGAICAGQASQGSNGGYGGDGGGLPLALGANGVPCGSYRYYAGGGGGGAGYSGGSQPAGAGGKGGGAAGKNGSAGPTTGNAGTTNSGGGGGGVATNSTGGTGGSGIVVIRYKFQN